MSRGEALRKQRNELSLERWGGTVTRFVAGFDYLRHPLLVIQQPWAFVLGTRVATGHFRSALHHRPGITLQPIPKELSVRIEAPGRASREETRAHFNGMIEAFIEAEISLSCRFRVRSTNHRTILGTGKLVRPSKSARTGNRQEFLSTIFLLSTLHSSQFL